MPFKPVNTAIRVIVGPAIDDTDFKTREEAIAYNQAGMEVDVILEKYDGTIVTTAVTPTSGGDYDWLHTDQGYYSLELPAAGGATFNNQEEGIITVVAYCTGVLPLRSISYDIVPTMIYDAFVEGTDTLKVDTVEISGDATAANNAELAFDGTGYGFTGCIMPTVTTLTGHTAQTGDNFARIGATGSALTSLAQASVCTEARLAELAAANIPSDIDDLLTRITAARAGYLDELAAANLPTDIADIPTVAEFEARSIVAADYVVVGDTLAAVTTVTNLTNAPTNGDLTATMKTSVNTEAKDVLTVDTIADSYATDGNQPTIAQAILAIQQMMQDKSISGTTLTVKKPDGSTTAMTFTLDSATTPTSITRAT